MPSYTRQLSEFAANLKLSEVPEDVIARAKSIVLDGLGCGLFGAQLKWTEILASVVRRLEPYGGQVSIWGRGETASAVNAALVNGTMIQGYELDDANPASIHSVRHPGGSIRIDGEANALRQGLTERIVCGATCGGRLYRDRRRVRS